VAAAALFLLATLLLLLLVEGTADLVHVLGRERPSPPRLEHLAYDPDLGWRGRPGFADPGYFGAGAPLTIDGNGFRAAGGGEAQPAGGPVGVVCLGGSATFGSGLGDGQTWPAELERLDRRLRAVNLGADGYAPHQSLLRYLREGRAIDHRTVVLAVTGDDPAAISTGAYFGWRRPRPRVDGRMVAAGGEPVPRRTAFGRALRRRLAPLGELRAAAVLASGRRPLRDLARPPERLVIDPAAGEAAMEVIAALARIVRADGRKLVVAYLPTRAELEEPRMHHFRRMLHRDLPGMGVLLADFAGMLEGSGPDSWVPLFSDPDRPGALTPQGSALVAGLLRPLLSPGQ
jgi:hypothetical protein